MDKTLASVWSGLGVCGGLCFAGGCAPSAVDRPTDVEQPVVASSPAPVKAVVERAGVTIEDAGAEPRRVLRFDPDAGWLGITRINRKLRQTASGNGQEMLVLDLAMTDATELSVVSTHDEGFTERARWLGAPNVSKLEGKPDVVADMRTKLVGPRPSAWSEHRVDSRGEHALGGQELQVPSAVESTDSGGVTISADSEANLASPFLPRAAVGIGAKWTFTSKGEAGASKVTLRLVGVDSGGATIEFVGEASAESTSASASASAETVVNGVSKSTGTCRWVPGLPTWQSLTTSGRTTVTHTMRRGAERLVIVTTADLAETYVTTSSK